MPAGNKNCIVKKLPAGLEGKLRQSLESRCWEFSDLPYARFKASREGTNVVLYDSGKLVAQGSGAGDFVEFILEPEVLGELAFQPDPDRPEEERAPHAGMDESGKGDFFGPLAVAAVYVGEGLEPVLADAGVRDCKLIKNDKELLSIAADTMKIIRGTAGVVVIGPEAYNRMYTSFKTLNKLLAWGHARALENLLGRVPECRLAIADKFGDESLIKRALGEKGRTIKLIQRTKAESDMAVAAASVLARAAFLNKLEQLGTAAGMRLPKGAGSQVDAVAAKLAAEGGREKLSLFAKMHFRNSYKALGLEMPEKPKWHHY